MARSDLGLKNTLTRNCNKEATFRKFENSIILYRSFPYPIRPNYIYTVKIYNTIPDTSFFGS